MKLLLPPIIVFLLVSAVDVRSQPSVRVITGLVTIEGPQTPLEGVMVKVKGTKNYSRTQPDGIFYLDIAPTDSVLVFTYDGFRSCELKITHEAEYQVSLKPVQSFAGNLYDNIINDYKPNNHETFIPKLLSR